MNYVWDVVIWVLPLWKDVVVVERKKNDWIPFSFPSWTIEQWETPEEAVIREIGEETWIKSAIVQNLWMRPHPKRTDKLFHYFLMRYESGNMETHDENIKQVMRVSINSLNELLWWDIYHPVLKALDSIVAQT
jgi:8-oxo-dGTP diphosphatase